MQPRLAWSVSLDPLSQYFAACTKIRACNDHQFATLCSHLPDALGRTEVQSMLERWLLQQVTTHTGVLPPEWDAWFDTATPSPSYGRAKATPPPPSLSFAAVVNAHPFAGWR